MNAARRSDSVVLGIDIGGSGVKGAPVEVKTGALVAERYRLPTPQPAAPAAVAEVVAEVAAHFAWHGPIGCAMPSVVKDGVAHTAANLDKTWIGTNGRDLFARTTGCPVVLLNDADAAGVAEMRLGAGRGQRGLVIMITLGTGIGTALFIDGVLVPNAELGHLIVRGKEAETRASDRARTMKDLSWKKWARRVDEYLRYVEALLNPDLFILGGGVSKKADKFIRHLSTAAPVVPATMRNEAGIVGAALAATDAARGRSPTRRRKKKRKRTARRARTTRSEPAARAEPVPPPPESPTGF